MAIKLVSISKNISATVFVFNVSHDNGLNTLDQELTLKRFNGQWTATMSFENFPEHHTPTGAVAKLSEWMERLTSELNNHPSFENIHLNTVQIYSKD